MSKQEKNDFPLKCPMCYLVDFITWANDKRKSKNASKVLPKVPQEGTKQQ